MLAVTIQPYDYSRMRSLKDLKSICILRFTHKGLLDEDFAYDVKEDASMSEIENKEELFDTLMNSIKKGNVITYNSRLLITTIHILADAVDKEVPDNLNDLIPDLMVKFSKLHNRGRWAKLQDALKYYGYTEKVDTSDPYDMCAKTIMLYRLMQEADEL